MAMDIKFGLEVYNQTAWLFELHRLVVESDYVRYWRIPRLVLCRIVPSFVEYVLVLRLVI